MLEPIEMLRHDAPEVFAAIERANAHAPSVRRRFLEIATMLSAELAEPQR